MGTKQASKRSKVTIGPIKDNDETYSNILYEQIISALIARAATFHKYNVWYQHERLLCLLVRFFFLKSGILYQP